MEFKPVTGVYPTMITPYNTDGTPDLGAVDALVDWYWQNGCDGIFAVCQSSEIFYLTLAERAAIAERVKLRADKLAAEDKSRAPLCVIGSGHISSDFDAQVEELNRIAAAGMDAVIWISNRLDIENTSSTNWISDAERLLRRMPDDLPLGVYECPMPYKRLLDDKILDWCASTGRFYFIKDTCCSPELLSRRCAKLAGKKLKLFNANGQTLLPTLREGGAGYCGIMANFHPRIYGWLCKNYEKEPEKAERVSELLSLAAFTEQPTAYPVTAKYHLSELEGVKMNLISRSRDMKELNEYQRFCVRQMAGIIREAEKRLGVR